MKVLAISGSPHKHGTTNTMITKFLNSLDEKHKISLNLNDLDYSGCRACSTCKQENAKRCVLQDDLNAVFFKMKEADLFILGSPIYMGEISGQTKLFMDRWYSLKDRNKKCHLPANKKAILIISQGAPIEDHYQNCCQRLEKTLKGYGFEVLETIVFFDQANLENAEFNKKQFARLQKLGENL